MKTEELFEDFEKCISGLEALVPLVSTKIFSCINVFLKHSPFLGCYGESSVISFTLPNQYCSRLVICLEILMCM